ncbi:MAG: Tm-1-like ATP-binding domain-containing protein [Chloroflexota bacterium]
MTPPVVAIVATLDTKHEEVEYVIGRLAELGTRVLTIDCGIRGEPGPVRVDVTRHEVAANAGTSIPELLALPDRGPAIAAMMRGLATLVPRLHAEGRFDRCLSLGGFNGALLGAAAMRDLPLGVPKLIISPIASGARSFGQFVGYTDIAVMHSVVDLQGLNGLACRVLDTAAGMIGGGPLSPRERTRPACVVALTVNGNTTPVAMRITAALRQRGCEVVPFHSNGAGGGAMEALVRAGEFDAVIDLTTNELAESLLGGIYPGAPGRLLAAGEAGLPTVVVPGCLDFTNQGPIDHLPERLRHQPMSPHNPEVTLVRHRLDDGGVLAAEFAGRVGRHPGPVEVVLPTDGLSMPGSAGGSFYDPEWDRVFIDAIDGALDPRIARVRVAAGINDDATSDAVVAAFDRVWTMAGGTRETTLPQARRRDPAVLLP